MRQATLHLDRAVLRKPSPGPEHSGHGWESLENNPAKLSPWTEGFQQASMYFKGLCGEWGWDRGP